MVSAMLFLPIRSVGTVLAVSWAVTGVGIVHAAEEAVEGTDATTGAFPPFEPSGFASQLFWLALTFGFFYWFLTKHALPRLEGTIEQRRTRIESDTVSARRLREEADAAEAAYNQDLATARQNAQSIATEAKDKATREANGRREEVERDLDKRLKDSEARIAAIKSDALSHVDEIAADVTGSILSQVTGRDYSDDAIRSAVAEAAAARRT